jgi:hypothetical protein
LRNDKSTDLGTLLEALLAEIARQLETIAKILKEKLMSCSYVAGAACGSCPDCERERMRYGAHMTHEELVKWIADHRTTPDYYEPENGWMVGSNGVRVQGGRYVSLGTFLKLLERL